MNISTASGSPANVAAARYIMIGGFLGAGKTTAVGRLARYLTERGRRVGLITNDQGSHLVDTNVLGSQGFAVEEISGGCFCCRFNSLVEAAGKLSKDSQPDTFIAEPVGSCTDLVATVTYPLRRMYGDRFSIAPLSVLVDPIRAMRVMGLDSGASFSEKVIYVYRKQLEEADLIVINKSELIRPDQLDRLRSKLAEQFPRAELFVISARQNLGLEPWFERILAADQVARSAIAIDYDIYAEGEALLGWMNATIEVNSTVEIDGNHLLRELATRLQEEIRKGGGEVAHLKITLEPEGGLGELGVVNLVRSDFVPELAQEISDPFTRAVLTLNVRAEVDPQVLQQSLQDAMVEVATATPHVAMTIAHHEFFRPGRPVPTHRFSS